MPVLVGGGRPGGYPVLATTLHYPVPPYTTLYTPSLGTPLRVAHCQPPCPCHDPGV